MDGVFLSVGSNLGNREANLRAAFSLAEKLFEDFRVSPLYQTAPLYVKDQPPYLNAVMGGRTRLRPFALLSAAQKIEAALGRDRSREKRRGPRTLDLDIILYGSLIVSTPVLTIPHPGIRERAFVIVPLLDVAPEARDPLRGDLYQGLLESVGDQGIEPYAGGF